MTPRQPAGNEPPVAGQPERFEHQQYEHDLPASDAPFLGPIMAVADIVLDAAQRAGLADGLSMRPPSQIPHTNAGSYEHPELKRMIDESMATQVHQLGQMWNKLGNQIMDFGANLQRTANSSEAIWVGRAGDAARATLSGLATWSQNTGQGVQYMSTTMRSQAEAAETATRSMPDPVPYDPAMYQNRMNSTINPVEWVQILGDARAQYERHNAAHEEAVRVTETYSASLHRTNGTMPAFAPPQEFGPDGGIGKSAGGPLAHGAGNGSGGGPGGGGPGLAPGIGNIDNRAPDGGPGGGVPGTGNGPGDGGASPDRSPAPTPGQVTPQGPAIPGGGLPGGGGLAGGGGPPGGGVPGFLPAAAAGLGRAGTAGGHGSGIGGGRGVGGGFGPRGSGGLSASEALGRGFGSPGAAESATGSLRGGGGRGPGVGGAFPPVAGAGHGQGGDDIEHQRPSYLVETEDIWGDGRRVAPPVIGEDPPEYYR